MRPTIQTICGFEGKRKTQGLSISAHCGEYCADLNRSINIAIEGGPALNQFGWRFYP
ncbi:MAG: hypothetical protein QXO23_07970 [Candidatus Methanomethyliaceae archaeon]